MSWIKTCHYLTTREVNQYGGVGTENNHVNMYATPNSSDAYYQQANNINGYGGMAYYSSETCNRGTMGGCKNNYEYSEIKYVIDSWVNAKFNNGSIKNARLITINDYKLLCVEVSYLDNSGDEQIKLEPQYDWLYNNNYEYWTMTEKGDSMGYVLSVRNDGSIFDGSTISSDVVVRPVVELYKSAL